MNNLATIYYISQGTNPEEHLSNIEKVCKGGCKLVQLRLKNLAPDIIFTTSKLALSICNKYGSNLIINDHTEIAHDLPVFGLHLGKTDTDINAAQAKISNKIIGGTANTIEDCIRLVNSKVDYIGLGPFRFTTTKTNLEPVLGIAGYQEVLSKLKALKTDIPIYAIGGIMEEDIRPLIKIGVTGVALSGFLSTKKESEIKYIIDTYERST